MCIALAAYGNRIASLFDSSDRFIIIKAPSYDLKKSESIDIPYDSPNESIQLLVNRHVNVLICGAISGCVRYLIEGRGIKVISWITGDVEKVIQAYRINNLFTSEFIMPGCKNNGRHRRNRCQKGRNFF